MWRAQVALSLLALTCARAQNRVIDVSTTCDRGAFTVALEMAQPFKGLLFSKDFSRECRVQGNHKTKVSLHLPTNACGVRSSTLNTTSDDQLYYTVELVVQMDRMLQQSTDQELVVRCKLQPRAVRINSSALEGVINSKLREMIGQEAKKTRTGRNRQGWVNPAEMEQREWLMESARAWMELVPAMPTNEPATVEVGQPTKLLIQCTLPVGVGLRITNCVAHDGLGEASQKLLDEAGCPIDESIFSTPSIHRHKKGTEIDFSDLEPVDPQRNLDENTHLKQSKTDPELMFKNIMTYQHAITTFAAFKFPDRAKLHLTCGIELCKGKCPIVDCKALQRPQQTREGLLRKARLDKDAKGWPQQTREGLLRKARLDKDAKGVVIDRLEVYNSIEVLAPNIELEDEASIRASNFGIELCKGKCPIVDCKALQRPQQTREGLLRKARLDKDAKGVVIDRLEVYNSIEVLAPNIELEDEASIRGSRRIESEEDEIIRGFSPGDKTICMSPGKMALAFCVLGVIFLCAIAVAFVSLVRARRRLGREPLHTSLSFYTGSKSMFSSSESSSSGLSGSKLLLTDSPYLDHHSSSSNNWPYSRAF
ncbi:uncharacterized protein LOC125235610 [Leguminivora glycinivorella]|uniref:uncharacterized protein LOC125235610 n=1 Tax=Leguminivora glycinivorella TaxID=1035111 RepID=UPI00200CA136|nr:uncharacterized protein LOC125235610 [Leguminivora glycinivorella]